MFLLVYIVVRSAVFFVLFLWSVSPQKRCVIKIVNLLLLAANGRFTFPCIVRVVEYNLFELLDSTSSSNFFF